MDLIGIIHPIARMDGNAQTQCSAICANGNQCTRNSNAHGMCRSHLNSQKKYGPHTYELKQLDYSHKKQLRDLLHDLTKRMDEISASDTIVDKRLHVAMVNRWYNEQRQILRGTHATERRNMRNRHAEIVEMEGRDPDAEANERRRIAREERDRRIAAWAEEVRNGLLVRHIIHQDEHVVMAGHEGVVFAAAQPPPQERDLRAIAADPQNVHTSEAVRHTKSIVQRVRTVPVPSEYAWDKDVCSKTPGEIIAECRLSPKAAWQMMAQYAQDTAIYDIEEGIYGKVLDSVWQFVKTHAEKVSLIAILRSEMEDNIGMCAQGNLTRICNILSGYMDGVGVVESVSEKLGRLLPPLREIADIDERLRRAIDIVADAGVHEDDWDMWIDPVME